MPLNQNALRTAGFSRKQVGALTTELGPSFVAQPINNYVEYARLSATDTFTDLSSGSAHLVTDATHPNWVNGTDIEINGARHVVVTTSGLYLLTGYVHFSYHDAGGTELGIDTVKGFTTATLGLPQGDDVISIPFHNTTLINFGWIDIAVTLYLPAGTELDFIVYGDVRKVSDNTAVKVHMNDAGIILTRYAGA